MSKKIVVVTGSPSANGNSDILVFASPIYWYGLSSQIKALKDAVDPGAGIL